MKTSLNHLPVSKRNQILEIVDIIKEVVSPEKIILFGSYAKGKYVEHRYTGKDGIFYIAEQEDGDKPAYICIRDPNGEVLARLESRHIHGVGVDSRGDIYAGLTVDRSVDKFVRKV